MVFVLTLLAFLMVTIQVIKFRIMNPPEPDIHFENDVERALKEQEADEKYVAALFQTNARKRKSASASRIITPEEAEVRIKPRRDREIWQPDIPGVVHDDHKDWTF